MTLVSTCKDGVSPGHLEVTWFSTADKMELAIFPLKFREWGGLDYSLGFLMWSVPPFSNCWGWSMKGHWSAIPFGLASPSHLPSSPPTLVVSSKPPKPPRSPLHPPRVVQGFNPHIPPNRERPPKIQLQLASGAAGVPSFRTAGSQKNHRAVAIGVLFSCFSRRIDGPGLPVGLIMHRAIYFP